MFRVAQIGTIRILINVPQANAPGIRVGHARRRCGERISRPRFTGKVTRTTNSLDPNSRTLLVEVQVPNPDGKLLPGMYSEVRFSSHRDSPPLLVPGDSLITTNNGFRSRCCGLDDGRSKKIHLQPVKIGRDYGAETEVIAGLEGRETVVVNPGDEVQEGALVRADPTGASRKGAAK